MKDHYQVLGVLKEVDDVVIKAAYKALAQKYHPDKHPEQKAEYNRIMSELNEAFSVLGFKHKRKEYDLKWSKTQVKAKPAKAKAEPAPHKNNPHPPQSTESEHSHRHESKETESTKQAKASKAEFEEILKKLEQNQIDEYQLINLFETTFSLKIEISSGYINNYSYMKDDKRHIVNFEKIKLELINHWTK
jgi:curved DNA-binding protein CbpA